MRLKHKSKGYRALLTDPAVVADLHDRTQRIAEAAGGDGANIYAPEPSKPRNRARAAVVAPLGDSDNRMIHALDAAR